MDKKKVRYWLKKEISKVKWTLNKDGWMCAFLAGYILNVTSVKNDYQSRCLWLVVKRSKIVDEEGNEGVRIAHGDASTIEYAKNNTIEALVDYIMANDLKEGDDEESELSVLEGRNSEQEGPEGPVPTSSEY